MPGRAGQCSDTERQAGSPALRTSDFDYDLPQQLIAQTPVEPRDHARLLTLDRRDGSIQHRRFYEIDRLLHPGDLLVFNDSRVIPARLQGRKAGTGGAVEVLLLHPMEPGLWQALVRPGRRLGPQALVEFLDREGRVYRAEIMERLEGGTRAVRFEDEAAIEACGVVPLPPYIREPLADSERYQTVYSRVSGSSAAPTAGLHFTRDLLERLSRKGVGFAFLTLHTGLDTFRPVEEEDPHRNPIHREYAVLSEEAARRINEARSNGGRIVCVGTTTARVLETAARPNPLTPFPFGSAQGRPGWEGGHTTQPPLLVGEGAGREVQELAPFAGWTDLFILPGHRFRAIDALVTNFHLPRSTLLMLVSAFASKTLIDRAYAEAMRERYRFYSFGDAMLIL